MVSTKLIFMGADDQAVVENIRPYKTTIECRDGDHHASPGTVWRDRSKTLPPILVVWHGLEAPEGEDWDLALAERAWIHQETHKVFRQRVRVSRLWARLLIKWVVVFGKLMVLVVGLALAVTLLYGMVVISG